MPDNTDKIASDRMPILRREKVEYWALIAEIVAALAVVLSLIFVGLQLRESNRVAINEARTETMSQWSSFRQTLYTDEDTAELFLQGLQDPDTLNETQQLRLDLIFDELTFATYQVHARSQEGLLPAENLQLGVRALLTTLCTPGGQEHLQQVLANPWPGFIAKIEEQIPIFEAETGHSCG